MIGHEPRSSVYTEMNDRDWTISAQRPLRPLSRALQLYNERLTEGFIWEEEKKYEFLCF